MRCMDLKEPKRALCSECGIAVITDLTALPQRMSSLVMSCINAFSDLTLQQYNAQC